MKKAEKDLSERVIALFKESGIILSTEQAKQVLKFSNPDTDLPLPDGVKLIKPQVIKGYKVYVEYEKISDEEMHLIKTIVARIICSAMKKKV